MCLDCLFMHKWLIMIYLILLNRLIETNYKNYNYNKKFILIEKYSVKFLFEGIFLTIAPDPEILMFCPGL